MRLAAASVLLHLLQSAPLSARTITLTTEDCDQMAAISALAPRLSWALSTYGGQNIYNSQPTCYWNSNIALLLSFPIADVVPKGQRITKAELTFSAGYVAGVPDMRVRRILAEWGNGVCYRYRMVHPQKVEWAQPGGRGASTDRANKDSASLKIVKAGEYTLDLTEDVELWYTGAVPNRGWILTLENEGHLAYLPSPYGPYGTSGKDWKLQITYEPK